MQLLYVLLVAMTCMIAGILTMIASVTLWWMLHAWRTPAVFAATSFDHPQGEPELSFSLIVPARHETAVLKATVEQLLASSFPEFEVVVVTGHDDKSTTAVAEHLATRHPERVKSVIDTTWPKNKPKALNTALPLCSGDVVGVFDAESLSHPDLLRHVEETFRRNGADVVQGGVQLINIHSSWYSVRNCLEYFFWFRSRLHLHAERKFIPLGGNTVFIRRELLTHVGGWDPHCLAEDCDLGVRLSVRGARINVAYDARLVTQEETPDSLQGLIRQRTRWNQGFLQVLRKNEWRRLGSRQERILARYTLSQPFTQAFSALLVPVALLTALTARLPVLITMFTFLPAFATIVMLLFEVMGLREFGRVYGARIRIRDYAKLLAGTALYQFALGWAALCAVAREIRGIGSWEKTTHTGAHLSLVSGRGERAA